MRALFLGLALLITGLAEVQPIVQQSQEGRIAEFPGRALRWITLAAPEFTRERLNVEKYSVIVTKKRNL